MFGSGRKLVQEGEQGNGVLRSSSPTGPWEDVLKAPLFPARTTGRAQYDPTILSDDGAAYLMWAVEGKWTDPAGHFIAKLTHDMLHLAEAPRVVRFLPSADNRLMPHADKPTLHKYRGTYYLSAADSYATASSVYGPYVYRGKTGAGGGHGSRPRLGREGG